MLSTKKVEDNEDKIQITFYAWWKFWKWCSGPKQITINGMKPDMVYMKMFKDMQVGDIDQLVPGSQVKFSLFDKLMIWVPVLFGFGMAIYKAAKGNLDFELWVHFFTTIFLVLFPLYYGYRAYS